MKTTGFYRVSLTGVISVGDPDFSIATIRTARRWQKKIAFAAKARRRPRHQTHTGRQHRMLPRQTCRRAEDRKAGARYRKGGREDCKEARPGPPKIRQHTDLLRTAQGQQKTRP